MKLDKAISVWMIVIGALMLLSVPYTSMLGVATLIIGGILTWQN